ncbi:hypothetical protein CBW46_011840 [Paenibacillus xerothermodurans]|uniref:Uncharacterized protein n=2 Tax=Paenibacillus xerothermodurans TaxID=1977292 RepID=A0A2W1P1A9_PAEXE|nr:hypothetical protein CBW46_011840 [Paenibacillus xerothermodurans]
MVVLLRSAGLPARWVKGFSPGTVVGKQALHAETAEAQDALTYSPPSAPDTPVALSEALSSDASVAATEASTPDASAAATGASSADVPVALAEASASVAPSAATEASVETKPSASWQTAAYTQPSASVDVDAGASAAISSKVAAATGGAAASSSEDGVVSGSADAPAHLYSVQVRNKDAHSWVEVYFPSVGWVPFDPTAGVSGAGLAGDGPMLINGLPVGAPSLGSPDGHTSAVFHEEGFMKYLPAVDQLRTTLRRLTDRLFTLAADAAVMIRRTVMWMKQWTVPSLCIAAAAILLFVHLCKKVLRRHPKPDKHSAQAARLQLPAILTGMRERSAVLLSERLWRKVQRRFGPAHPAQTLREYAVSRPSSSDRQRHALVQFVRLIETVRYEQGGKRVTKRQLQDCWRELRQSTILSRDA